MGNVYEHLRTDTQEILGDAWMDYPLANDYETIDLYRNGDEHILIFVGRQDGVWVIGMDALIGNHGHAFGITRKWGQFASRNDALLWAYGEILTDKENMKGEVKMALGEAIEKITQLVLF